LPGAVLQVEGISSKYYVDCKPQTSSAASYDLESARRLWQLSEELTGGTMPTAIATPALAQASAL